MQILPIVLLDLFLTYFYQLRLNQFLIKLFAYFITHLSNIYFQCIVHVILIFRNTNPSCRLTTKNVLSIYSLLECIRKIYRNIKTLQQRKNGNIKDLYKLIYKHSTIKYIVLIISSIMWQLFIVRYKFYLLKLMWRETLKINVPKDWVIKSTRYIIWHSASFKDNTPSLAKCFVLIILLAV